MKWVVGCILWMAVQCQGSKRSHDGSSLDDQLPRSVLELTAPEEVTVQAVFGGSFRARASEGSLSSSFLNMNVNPQASTATATRPSTQSIEAKMMALRARMKQLAEQRHQYKSMITSSGDNDRLHIASEEPGSSGYTQVLVKSQTGFVQQLETVRRIGHNEFKSRVKECFDPDVDMDHYQIMSRDLDGLYQRPTHKKRRILPKSLNNQKISSIYTQKDQQFYDYFEADKTKAYNNGKTWLKQETPLYDKNSLENAKVMEDAYLNLYDEDPQLAAKPQQCIYTTGLASCLGVVLIGYNSTSYSTTQGVLHLSSIGRYDRFVDAFLDAIPSDTTYINLHVFGGYDKYEDGHMAKTIALFVKKRVDAVRLELNEAQYHVAPFANKYGRTRGETTHVSLLVNRFGSLFLDYVSK